MAENILNLNLSSYQKQVGDLTAKLSTLKQGTQEYNSVQKQLQSVTNQASAALSAANSTVTTSTSSMGSLTSSLNTLTESFRTANSAFEQQQISNQITEVSNSITAMQQNASSSFSQVSTALSSLGVPINGVVGLVTNLQGTMTSLSTVLTGGIAAVKAFGAQLNTLVSSNPYLAAIAAVLGTLVGVFKLFSSNLKDNASHGKQWKRIMATFQPVINIVKNALDKLFGVILDGMEWLADNLPSALTWIGKNANWLIQKVFVPIVTVVDYIPKKLREAMSAAVKLWAKGWSKIAGLAADVVEWFGFDELGEKIRSFSSKAVSAINWVADAYAGFDSAAFLSNLGNSIESSLNSVAGAMKVAKNMEHERQDIVKEQQDQEYKNIKVEGEIAKLRDQAARTSNKAEKKRLNERAKNLEEANSRENVLLKERYYNYLKWRNAQSATSAAEAKEEREARNDIERERTASYQRQIKYDKAITTNTVTSSSGGVSRTAESTKKAAESSISELKDVLNKAAEEILDNWKIFLLHIRDGLTSASTENEIKSDQLAVITQIDKILPDDFRPFQYKPEFMKKLDNVLSKANNGISVNFSEFIDAITKGEVEKIEKSASVIYKDSNFSSKIAYILQTYLTNAFYDSITIAGKQYRIISANASEKLETLWKSITKDMTVIPKTLVSIYENMQKQLKDPRCQEAQSAAMDLILDEFGKQSTFVDIQVEHAKGEALDRIKNVYTLSRREEDDIRQQMNGFYEDLAKLKPQISTQLDIYKEAAKRFKEIAIVAAPDSDEYKEMQKAYTDAKDTFLKLFTDYFEVYNKEKQKVDEFVEYYTAKSDAEYLKEYYETELKALQEAKDDEEKAAEILENLLNPKYNKILKTHNSDTMSSLVATAQGDYNNVQQPKKHKNTEYSHSGDAEYNKKIAEASDKLVDYQASLEQLIDEYNAYVDKSTAEASDNLAKQAELRYNIEKTSQERLNLLAEKNQAKRTKIINQTLKVYSQMASAVGTICSDIASYQQSRIESELEAGKITEEQAQAQFERTKRTAIAGAVISLLGTIPSEIYTIWKDGSGLDLWGKIAMTATTTASTIAAGVLQIQKLRSTTLNSTSADSSSAGISASMAAAQATPLLDENQDIDKIQQLKVQTEQRVYILEQDIQDSNKRVQVRQKNTTF